LAFASWASRIPILKENLALTDAQLGTILLMLPVGQLLTMAISGKLVSTYGSAKVLRIVALLYATVLCLIGFTTNAYQLGAVLFLFGIVGNMCNIAVNTQGVAVEEIFQKIYHVFFSWCMEYCRVYRSLDRVIDHEYRHGYSLPFYHHICTHHH